ncbi:MAG: class I SAM-dependent methyltransferase [Nanoarchaeota archaeon]|nr:class I SAM-dependent methyltransferase [Nanoarchaeota archaeon]
MKKSTVDRVRERFHYSRYNVIKRLIHSEKKNLLDIGCGKPCDSMRNGAFLRFMGYGTGIDIVEHDIEFPTKRCSVTELDFEDNTFDVVVASQVLEHVKELNKALAEIKRVLKKDGVLVMDTPNNSVFWNIFWFFWVNSSGKMWKHTHVIELNKKQWLNLLSKHFRIEKVVDLHSIILIVKMRKK